MVSPPDHSMPDDEHDDHDVHDEVDHDVHYVVDDDNGEEGEVNYLTDELDDAVGQLQNFQDHRSKTAMIPS